MTRNAEADIRDLLINRKTVNVTWDGGQGVVVSAIPDIESRRGLLCDVAPNARTLEEAENVIRDQLIQVNHRAFTTCVAEHS